MAVQSATDDRMIFIKQFSSIEEEEMFCLQYGTIRSDFEKYQLFCKSLQVANILKTQQSIGFQKPSSDELFFNLWKSLDQNKVRYLVAGGLAMLVCGHSFADNSHIDIWVEDIPGNRRNLHQSFVKAAYGDFPEIETLNLTDYRLMIFISGSFPIRIFGSIEGIADQSFGSCLETANLVDFHGIKVPFMYINDLISNKKAVSRPKDQIDLIELEKIRKILQDADNKKTS